MKCSVLMPVFNGEKHLKDAIDSILNQSFKDYEFIIINDGSTDSSEEIILSYKDSRIKYVENTHNLKLIKTLNKGLNLCQGEYIARMDADDIALPTKLEEQISYLEAHPEMIVCGTQIERFGSKRRPKNKVSWIKENNDEIKAQLFMSNCFAHPSVVIRASVLRESNIKYNADYIHVEDYKMWIDLAEFGDFHNIPKSLLRYRLTDDQISTKFQTIQARHVHKIRCKLINQFLSSFDRGFELPDEISISSIKKVKDLERQFGNNENIYKFSTILTVLYLSIKPNLGAFLVSFDYLRKGFTTSSFIRILKHMKKNEIGIIV